MTDPKSKLLLIEKNPKNVQSNILGQLCFTICAHHCPATTRLIKIEIYRIFRSFMNYEELSPNKLYILYCQLFKGRFF